MIRRPNAQYVVEKDTDCKCWIVVRMNEERTDGEIIDHKGDGLAAWREAVSDAFALASEDRILGVAESR